MITAAPARWAHSSHAGSILSSYKRASYIIPNSQLFTSSFTTTIFYSIYFQLYVTEIWSLLSQHRIAEKSCQEFWYMKLSDIQQLCSEWGKKRLFRNANKKFTICEKRTSCKSFFITPNVLLYHCIRMNTMSSIKISYIKRQ